MTTLDVKGCGKTLRGGNLACNGGDRVLCTECVPEGAMVWFAEIKEGVTLKCGWTWEEVKEANK